MMMSRFVIALLFLFPLFAADNPAAGVWNCTSLGGGETRVWTLIVKDDAGKPSGLLQIDAAELPLTDIKIDGKKFTFTISINDAAYLITTTIDGDTIQGSFKGPEAAGTLKGTRQTVVGRWKCASKAGGEPVDWTLIVKENAGTLSGLVDLGYGELALSELKFDGKQFTFKFSINEKPYIANTTIDGDTIQGSFKGEEASGTLKGTRQKEAAAPKS